VTEHVPPSVGHGSDKDRGALEEITQTARTLQASQELR
jgi:hypothetical protein